jgi:FkbM family methyltransferase
VGRGYSGKRIDHVRIRTYFLLPTSNFVLRSLIRRTPLLPLADVVMRGVEWIRLARLCRYRVDDSTPGEVTFTWSGQSLRLQRTSLQFREMALSRHERPTTAAFLKYVSPGTVVWDVGANVGYYTALLAALVGNAGCVQAFEPNPANLALLEQSITAAQRRNVVIHRCALGEHDDRLELAGAGQVTSTSRIMSSSIRQPVATTLVSVRAGDSIVKAGASPIPEFVKIDVEGYEIEVLRGLEKTLSTSGCRFVLCEVHFALLTEARRTGADREIRRLLRSAGFSQVQWVSRSHLLALK